MTRKKLSARAKLVLAATAVAALGASAVLLAAGHGARPRAPGTTVRPAHNATNTPAPKGPAQNSAVATPPTGGTPKVINRNRQIQPDTPDAHKETIEIAS